MGEGKKKGHNPLPLDTDLHTQETSFVKVFFRFYFLLLIAANAQAQNNEI